MKLIICVLVIAFHVITCKSMKDTLYEGRHSLTLMGKLHNGKEFYTDLSVGLLYATHAFDLCHWNGLRAATIETEEENAYVAKLLENAVPNYQYFWIAATDLYHERDWTNFVNGRNLTYTNWRDENLNSVLVNCVYMTKSGAWIQTSCSGDTNRPLCEL